MKFKSFMVLSAMALSLSVYAQGTSAPDSNVNSPGTTTDTMRVPSSDTTTDTTTTTTTTAPSSDSANANLSPKDVCQKIVELQKQTRPNLSQMDQFVLGRQEGRKAAGKMMEHKWLKDEIVASDCSSETIAGNHAFVVAKSGDKQRLLPFVKMGNSWKLDTMAYHSFYRMERIPASVGK